MNAMIPPEEIPEAREPFLRIPIAVSILGGLLLAIYGLWSIAPAALQESILENYAFIPARYSPAFLAAHGSDGGSLVDRALPFASYIFLHGSWTHVIFNTVWLLAFGPVVARRFGMLRFFVFFLICGVAGAAFQLVCNWASREAIIGASAAISGLMAAGFRLIGREGSVFGPPQPMAPILSRQILMFSGVWVAINIVAGVTGLGAGPGIQLIAWQAHLGGFAAGLLLAGRFDPFIRLNQTGE
ncbi:MAG TPA: rhomboid family intramembrane serine protease [Rhizomicrobium sp.]